jgi:hypothetical protein
MNDLNPLEKQLASWTPRRPSAELRRQLFPAAAPEYHRPAPRASLWLPITAAACVFLLALCPVLPHRAPAAAMTASGGSNLIASLSLSASSCSEWNLWSAVTFDWTKARSSLSITGPFGLGRTNL